MTEPTQPGPKPGPATTPPATPSAPEPPTRVVGARWWLIPAVTFVIGLLLGGVVVGVLRSGSVDVSGAASPSATATGPQPTSTGTGLPATATVVVPAECVDVARDSQTLVELTEQAASAARDLDAGRLSDVVRQIDEAQATLRTHAEACRAVDASLTSGSTPSVTTPSDPGSSAPTTGSSVAPGTPSTSTTG
ncbi:hypothetical protein [Humibacillus xanthopallidus]|uniref:hypothetical protein n=1 Tax=Humibacillus xanthopallidus TaxID=412689 RepID=UPI00384C3393